MSEFLSLIAAPIAGGDPFGADVNRDLDYERLKNEMGKLGDIDVGLVESLSVKILTERSKDVRAMAFLAYSLLRKNDFGRLADVFCALADYCRGSFDGIFPRREGAKLAALRWLSESRFAGQCERAEVFASDAPHTVRMVDALSNLRAALGERFADGGPSLSLLYKRAAEWKKTADSKAAAEPSSHKNEDSRNENNTSGYGSGGAKQGHDADRESNIHAQQPSAGPSATSAPDTVVIKLSRDEYIEVLDCFKKLEATLMTASAGTAGF